jgi:hypothetical protein
MATGSGAAVGVLSLASDGVLHLDGGSLTATSVNATAGTILWNRGELRLAGGNSLVPNGLAVPDLSLLAGNGDVAGPISGAPLSTIRAEGGNLTLGVANSFLGFNHAGVLEVGANTVTLRSLGFANLGVLTTMAAGGSLVAVNGVAFDAGDSFQGAGTINARVAQRVGSTIMATGDLSLGSSSAVDGYVGEGVLHTGTSTVTLLDANQAVLGSLTTLGSGSTPGTLAAANGAVVDFGDNMTGVGLVSTPNNALKPFINNGVVQGTSAARRLTLSGYVKGVGTFDNVNFTGTLSPGFSPTILSVGNIALSPASTLVMELGGTTPGTDYDQIISSGALAFDGTLQVALINGFSPTAGQSFNLFDWASLSGTFDMLELPALAGLTWNTSQLYTTGVLSLSALLAGDYNLNGTVDAADYVVWRNNPGEFPTNAYTTWRANYGQTAGSAIIAPNAAVPEPSTTVMLLSVAAALRLRRRRAA